jgi:penicillin G amidase
MHAWQERVVCERFPEHLLTLLQGPTGVAARLIEGADLDWFAHTDLRSELLAAARDTLARVRLQYGADPAGWSWGTVHQAHWRHPLSSAERTSFDVGPRPVDGGAETVRNTGAGQPPFAATSGAEYRLVLDFAQPTRFLAVQNIGNSGQPGTPHYADQFDAWLAGEYHVVSLERAEVEADLETLTVIDPQA